MPSRDRRRRRLPPETEDEEPEVSPSYDAVYFTINTADVVLGYEEIVEAVDGDERDIDAALSDLQDERAIRYSGRDAGYVVNPRESGVSCSGCGDVVPQDERSWITSQPASGGRREYLVHERCRNMLLRGLG